MRDLVLMLTQLSGASVDCLCLTSKHHARILIMDNLLAMYFVDICSNDMPLTIGPTNRENTFM